MMTENTSELVVSVVVCTFNRSDLLPGCLDSLADQMVDKSTYEVIIINNNSTDNTQEIAESFARREPNFRVVMEVAQGLSHARNKGWKEARSRYVAYIDDDARADQNWLINAMKVIEEHSPDIFGGPIYPFYLTQKPRWFKDEYEIRQTTSTPRSLNAKEYISGSNFIVMRSLLERLEGFRADLGMRGNDLAYGEEVEFIIRARKEDARSKIYYDPAVRVRHFVPEHKMHVRYFIKAKWSVGRQSTNIFHTKHGTGITTIRGLLRIVAFITFSILVGVFVRNRSTYPNWQNYIIERVAPLFSSLGRYMTVMKQ